MTNEPMSMERVAMWDVPHVLWRETRDGLQRVFSYGLLVAELPQLWTSEGFVHLAERWERLELEQLRHRLGWSEAGEVKVPARRRLLESFSRHVRTAAAAGAVFPAGHEQELRGLLDDVERPDRFRWAYRNMSGRRVQVRVARCDELIHRLAVEVDDLVTRRPRLTVCKLCGRAFVPDRPARPERFCRANLWLPGSPPRMLERCIPLDDRERDRARRRLDQRYRRALQRWGALDPRTKVAAKERRLWARDNPPQRPPGRQPRPIPTYEPEGENDG